MGRKPLALIEEFFTRGPKIEDASNRYEQTCKACGEVFPKGRTDTLKTHLLKKCPAISGPSRQRVMQLTSSNSVPGQHTNAVQHGIPLPAAAQPALTSNVGSSNSDFNIPDFASASNFGFSNGGSFHQEVNFQQQSNLLEESDFRGDVPPKRRRLIEVRSSPGHLPTFDNTYAGYVPAYQPSDALRPLDYNDHDSSVYRRVGQQNIDPSLEHQASHEAISTYADHDSDVVDNSTLLPHAPSLRASSSKTTVPSMSDLQGQFHAAPGASNPTGPKARRGFGEIRKAEVKEMRQTGACLRCKMLKKTCSQGTPCKECSNITNHRTWYLPCRRESLTAEAAVFSTTLCALLSTRDMNLFRDSMTTVSGLQSGLELSATQFTGSNVAFCLFDLSYQRGKVTEDGEHPQLLVLDPKSITTSLHAYIGKVSQESFAMETNDFLRETLLFSSGLNSPKNDSLTLALTLWTAVSLNGNPDLQWDLTVRASASHVDQVVPPLDTNSRRLILGQVESAVEVYASNLAKEFLKRLEASFLKPKTVDSLQTQLAVIVFLNAVERQCCRFGLWLELPEGDDGGLPAWPIKDKLPGELVIRGIETAELLAFLLGVRDLLIDLDLDEAGIIRVRGTTKESALPSTTPSASTSPNPMYVPAEQSVSEGDANLDPDLAFLSASAAVVTVPATTSPADTHPVQPASSSSAWLDRVQLSNQALQDVRDSKKDESDFRAYDLQMVSKVFELGLKRERS